MTEVRTPAINRIIDRYGFMSNYQVLTMAIRADYEIGEFDVDGGLGIESGYTIEGDIFSIYGIDVPYDKFEDYHDALQEAYIKSVIDDVIKIPGVYRFIYYGTPAFKVFYHEDGDSLHVKMSSDNFAILGFESVGGKTYDKLIKAFNDLIDKYNKPMDDIEDQKDLIEEFIGAISDNAGLYNPVIIDDVTYELKSDYDILLVTYDSRTHVCVGSHRTQSMYLDFPGTETYDIFRNKITLMSTFKEVYRHYVLGNFYYKG